MFLFCLAFQTALNIELYNNPDKQERKQNETIITASSLRYTLPRKTRHGSRLQRSHFKHFENYDQSAWQKLRAKAVSYSRDERPVKVRDNLPHKYSDAFVLLNTLQNSTFEPALHYYSVVISFMIQGGDCAAVWVRGWRGLGASIGHRPHLAFDFKHLTKGNEISPI